MDNKVTRVEIKNFKSIKELELKGCRRVNLFIGKPNTGKSNILEALSLFCTSIRDSKYPFLKPFIRFNEYNDLFFENDTRQNIVVKTDDWQILLRSKSSSQFEIIMDDWRGEIISKIHAG